MSQSNRNQEAFNVRLPRDLTRKQSSHNQSEFILETKEAPRRQPSTKNQASMDVFGVNQQKKMSSQTNFYDPFSMDNQAKTSTPKQPSQDVFTDDLLGSQPAQAFDDPFGMGSAPQKSAPTPASVSNQDDLDIFFGTSANQPAPAPTRPAEVQNRPSDMGQVNKNDVSGFTVYNQLNNSNMKDMSAMGINNFLDINQQAPQEQQGTPKFNLRDEPSGTIFDEGGAQGTQNK